jgi:hypothetical protein
MSNKNFLALKFWELRYKVYAGAKGYNIQFIYGIFTIHAIIIGFGKLICHGHQAIKNRPSLPLLNCCPEGLIQFEHAKTAGSCISPRLSR